MGVNLSPHPLFEADQNCFQFLSGQSWLQALLKCFKFPVLRFLRKVQVAFGIVLTTDSKHNDSSDLKTFCFILALGISLHVTKYIF